MKIEKINENQIRCTLTREDLVSRHIKLSELAYGSAKARELFRELMEQASYQVGFYADEVPLMIEAVPLSSESIVLIVTKVDSPDELDTRFSRFSESDDDDYEEDYLDINDTKPSLNNTTANDILKLFDRMIETAKKEIAESPEKAAAAGIPVDITKMFTFDSLDDVIRLSPMLDSFYSGKNSLYKNPVTNRYYLVVSKSSDTPQTYNKVCNILAEYGDQNNFVIGTDSYMSEHYQTLVKGNAISELARI